MIRCIQPQELPDCAALGKSFFESLRLPGEYKESVFVEYWNKLIGNGAGFIIGRFSSDKPVEAIGAVVYPDMQTGELTSCTVFWYARPSESLAAGLLESALRVYWKGLEVKHGFVSVLCNERLDKVSGFLLRSGYHLAEMQFRKTI